MQRRNVKFEKISMIQNVAILQLLNFDKKHPSDELLASRVYLTFDPGQMGSTRSHIEKKADRVNEPSSGRKHINNE